MCGVRRRTISVIMAALMILTGMLRCISCTGTNNDTEEENAIFEVVYTYHDGVTLYRVLRHKPTGILYLEGKVYNGAGLTVMVDADGNPLTKLD